MDVAGAGASSIDSAGVGIESARAISASSALQPGSRRRAKIVECGWSWPVYGGRPTPQRNCRCCRNSGVTPGMYGMSRSVSGSTCTSGFVMSSAMREGRAAPKMATVVQATLPSCSRSQRACVAERPLRRNSARSATGVPALTGATKVVCRLRSGRSATVPRPPPSASPRAARMARTLIATWSPPNTVRPLAQDFGITTAQPSPSRRSAASASLKVPTVPPTRSGRPGRRSPCTGRPRRARTARQPAASRRSRRCGARECARRHPPARARSGRRNGRSGAHRW